MLGVEGLSNYGFTSDFLLWILGFAIEGSKPNLSYMLKHEVENFEIPPILCGQNRP
jgi:hypothetical protein